MNEKRKVFREYFSRNSICCEICRTCWNNKYSLGWSCSGRTINMHNAVSETCEDLMWRDLRSNVARPISLSIPHFLLWALLVCLASDLHKLWTVEWTLQNYLFVFTFACMEYNFVPKCELKWSRRDTNIQRSFKYLSFSSSKIFVICEDLWLRKCSGKPARQPPWWWVDPLYHQLISHYAHPWLPDWIFKDEEIWTWSSRSPLWYVWSDDFKVQHKWVLAGWPTLQSVGFALHPSLPILIES